MKYYKSLGIIALAGMLSTSVSASAPDFLARPAPVVFVDGKKVESDVPLQIINERIMAPMRSVFEALGAQVEWMADTKEAVSTKGNTRVCVKLDSNKMYVNDREVLLDSAPALINDRILIPIRAVSEAYEYDVKWYDKSRFAEITKPTSEPENTDDNDVQTEIENTNDNAEQTENKDKPQVEWTDGAEEEFTEYEISVLPEKFFEKKSWQNASEVSGGVKVKAADDVTPSYFGEIMPDGFYEFDMKITNPNSWPQLILRAKIKAPYTRNQCYMIGFNEEYIELQRFISGERTVFFGTDTFSYPLSGKKIDNRDGKVIEYGKTHHVITGTQQEENGVRIVFIVDGKTIINTVDTSEKSINEPGYLGIYVGSEGDFTFTPHMDE